MENSSNGIVEEKVDTVVIGAGMTSQNDLCRDLEGLAEKIVVVGDADKPADGVKAFRDGYDAAYNL